MYVTMRGNQNLFWILAFLASKLRFTDGVSYTEFYALENRVKRLESMCQSACGGGGDDNSVSQTRPGDSRIMRIGGARDGHPLSRPDVIMPNEPSSTMYMKVNVRMESSRTRHSAAVSNGSVYIFGGTRTSSDLDIVEVYDPRQNRFRLGPPLNHHRDSAASVALKGRIYACGGLSDRKALKTCEYFDPVKNSWSTDIADMPKPRAGATGAAVGDFIYIIGGSDPENRRDPDNKVERYSVNYNSWQEVSPMKHQRLYGSAAVVNNEIFVCGGMEEFTKTENCERYDPKKDAWSDIANMLAQRERLGDGLALVNFNGRLLVVGSDEVDEYDLARNSWKRLPGKLKARTGFVAVVL